MNFLKLEIGTEYLGTDSGTSYSNDFIEKVFLIHEETYLEGTANKSRAHSGYRYLQIERKALTRTKENSFEVSIQILPSDDYFQSYINDFNVRNSFTNLYQKSSKDFIKFEVILEDYFSKDLDELKLNDLCLVVPDCFKTYNDRVDAFPSIPSIVNIEDFHLQKKKNVIVKYVGWGSPKKTLNSLMCIQKLSTNVSDDTKSSLELIIKKYIDDDKEDNKYNEALYNQRLNEITKCIKDGILGDDAKIKLRLKIEFNKGITELEDSLRTMISKINDEETTYEEKSQKLKQLYKCFSSIIN